MNNSFSPGDVVQMKSGGPVMTVVSTDGDQVECHWFDEKNKPQSSSFPAVILEKYEPGEMFIM